LLNGLKHLFNHVNFVLDSVLPRMSQVLKKQKSTDKSIVDCLEFSVSHAKVYQVGDASGLSVLKRGHLHR